MKKVISIMLSLCLCCCVAFAASPDVAKSEEAYLGVDIGGQSVKMAVYTADGTKIEEGRPILTNKNTKPQAMCKAIAKEASKLRNFSKIKSVGVGCPGDTDFDNGIMRMIPQFPNFKNVPLAKLLESEIGKKVYMDNDANVAALGAFYIDAGGKATNLVYVTLGTGIGGGLIFNKEVYRGSSGSAGEIGHIAVEPKRGPNCDCGSVGCVEAFTGERYFLKYVEGYLQHHPSKIISELREKNNNQLSGKLLFDAAEMGDKIAKEMWKHYGEKLGFMLADIINILNPDTIVLGGGMSKSSKYFMPTIQKEVKNRAYAYAVKTCKIIVSQQGGSLGSAGAAMLAKESAAHK